MPKKSGLPQILINCDCDPLLNITYKSPGSQYMPLIIRVLAGLNRLLNVYFYGQDISDKPSYYERFNTGNGEILPCVGCYQLPFRLTLLVITR